MSYFGVCPHCLKDDGYVNVHKSHWGVCHTHKTRWSIGSGLFSSWHDETEEDWKKNEAMLRGYTKVEPASDPEYPPGFAGEVSIAKAEAPETPTTVTSASDLTTLARTLTFDPAPELHTSLLLSDSIIQEREPVSDLFCDRAFLAWLGWFAAGKIAPDEQDYVEDKLGLSGNAREHDRWFVLAQARKLRRLHQEWRRLPPNDDLPF
jgi:hypothetical protein